MDPATFRSCMINVFPTPAHRGMVGNACLCLRARRAAPVSPPEPHVEHGWSWVRHAETPPGRAAHELRCLLPVAGRISSGCGCPRSSSPTSTTTARVRRATAPRWGQRGCASSACRKVGGAAVVGPGFCCHGVVLMFLEGGNGRVWVFVGLSEARQRLGRQVCLRSRGIAVPLALLLQWGFTSVYIHGDLR